MIRFLTAAATVILAAASGSAQAAENQGGMGKMGKMGKPGDAQQASANPSERYFLTVYALPEMQKELGLSAQQLTQLRQYRQDFLAKGDNTAFAAAEAFGEMKTVLTPAQQEKLAATQPAELHGIAMSRLSAEDSGKLMAALPAHAEAAGKSAMGCKMMSGGDSAAAADHSHH